MRRSLFVSIVLILSFLAFPGQAQPVASCGGTAPSVTSCVVKGFTVNGNPDLDTDWDFTFKGGLQATFDSATGHFVRTCWDGSLLTGNVILCDSAMDVRGSFHPGQKVTMTVVVRKGPYFAPQLDAIGRWVATMSDDPME
jgi:hypothetical protein